jgi:hypothetical protein
MWTVLYKAAAAHRAKVAYVMTALFELQKLKMNAAPRNLALTQHSHQSQKLFTTTGTVTNSQMRKRSAWIPCKLAQCVLEIH